MRYYYIVFTDDTNTKYLICYICDNLHDADEQELLLLAEAS